MENFHRPKLKTENSHDWNRAWKFILSFIWFRALTYFPPFLFTGCCCVSSCTENLPLPPTQFFCSFFYWTYWGFKYWINFLCVKIFTLARGFFCVKWKCENLHEIELLENIFICCLFFVSNLIWLVFDEFCVLLIFAEIYQALIFATKLIWILTQK